MNENLTEKQNEILNFILSKVEIGNWFSHVIIRKSGGGEYGKGYFDFDAFNLDNLKAVKRFIEMQIEHLEKEYKGIKK